jgi:hypothetical protein
MNNSLMIQILILFATFLFYRILRTGFDSWTAVLIDFGAVIFMFGLQYILQLKSNKNIFPSGSVSSVMGAVFPDRISTGEENESKIVGTKVTAFRLADNIYLEPAEKQMIQFEKSYVNNPMQQNVSSDLEINKSGFYMMMVSIQADQSPFSAKMSFVGQKNNVSKSIHQGENNFMIYLQGQDKISFEIENGNSNAMILDTSSMFVVDL